MKAWINDKEFTFNDGETVLAAAKRLGVFIPTLCAYLPIDHTPGTCRLCLVEVTDGSSSQIVCACKTPLADGMRIRTKTPEVRRMQRQQVAWIFADHDQNCSSCTRYANCELQELALYVGLHHNGCNGRFTGDRPLDVSAAGLVRDTSKCVRCGRCVEVCRRVQGLSVLKLDGMSTKCGIGIDGADHWADSAKCVQCGQCSLVCPTGTLSEKDETDKALDWLNDPDVKTIVAFSPAVRVTLGESFGAGVGANVEGQVIAALKRLGADFVCDVNWAADLTILEEGTELLGRLEGEGTLPMMTSCCSGWINFVEKVHPELIPNLSTCRSPQGMFGSLAKTWFAKSHGIDPGKLRFISIMPCTAKKEEIKRPQLARDGVADTDVVLTVREFARLLRREGLNLLDLEPQRFDSPFMSENTGAGAIFGATGGVMEAAVRTVYCKVTGRELESIDFTPVRGMAWLKEAQIDLGERKLRIAVVHGLANAEKVAQDIKAGTCRFDFIEVMACPGGCINGGGTPRLHNAYLSRTEKRIEGIYAVDADRPLRQSHKNPDVIRLYDEFLGEPNSHKAHDLLHTYYSDRRTAPRRETILDLWDKLKFV